jgi:hypothetical protein
LGATTLIRFNRDLERLWPALVALATAVAFWSLLAALSHGVDRPPVINKIQVEPAAVPRGSTAVVRIQAMDPDGGRLTYDCAAESGRCVVADKSKPEAAYSPAERESIVDRVTVTVTDRGALLSTGSQIVTIEGAVAAPPQASGTNHPPVLNGGGGPLSPDGDKPLVLEATGSDPDGDNVTFNWEFGSCLVSANAAVSRAEVHLRPGCDSGNALLTWTDAHGATATAEWTIHR